MSEDPKFTEDEDYYIFEGNNRYSKPKYSKERAIEAFRTLLWCTDCVNCYNCFRCEDCYDCIHCTDCIDCKDCSRTHRIYGKRGKYCNSYLLNYKDSYKKSKELK